MPAEGHNGSMMPDPESVAQGKKPDHGTFSAEKILTPRGISEWRRVPPQNRIVCNRA
jgi:hypothetical protein